MKTNCLTNNVSDMNIENFEMFLRQGNMAENTIAAYLYAVRVLFPTQGIKQTQSACL